MELATAAAVIGIIAAVVYVVETAYKYGSAIFKKNHRRPRARQNDTPFVKPNLISIGGHHYVPRHLLFKKI
jgi:hypothetical protein